MFELKPKELVTLKALAQNTLSREKYLEAKEHIFKLYELLNQEECDQWRKDNPPEQA